MKKLIALLAVFGFVSYAHAGDGTEFSQSGDFRVQYQHDVDTNYDGTASSESIHQRMRWGANWRAGEKLSAHLKMVDNANWGENPDQVPAGRTSAPVTNTSGATTNVATVQEAYGVWQASDSVTIKAGRSSLTLGDGRWISANDYENVNNAIDGVIVKWDQEMFRVVVAGARAAQASTVGTVTTGNNVARLWGADVAWKTAPDFLKTVSAHYALVRTDEGDYGPAAANPFPKEESVRYGVNVAGDKMGVDYRANYEMYTGKRTSTAVAPTTQDVAASMMDAEVGYSMPSLMGLRAHVLYHTDSGSKVATKDETYQGFYYDRHENGGLMGLFSWGNLTYTSLGVSANPRDDISVAVNYYMYGKTENADNNYTGAGKAVVNGYTNATTQFANGSNGASTDKALGNELDVVVTKKYTNNFNINAHYSTFSPGAVLKTNTGHSETASQIYLASTLTF